MKLEDWPIDAQIRHGCEALICAYRGDSAWCTETLKAPAEDDCGPMPLAYCTIGELTASIVEHAKTVHGIEFEPSTDVVDEAAKAAAAHVAALLNLPEKIYIFPSRKPPED